MDVERFKFLDESGVNLSLTRLYGRAAPDQRVVENSPLPSGARTTTLAVIGATGITAPLVVSGAVNGNIFYGYIEQCVVPTLKPGDILFMDNLSAHKVAGIEALIQGCGAHLIYLPPYSPDFNPIENGFSKLRAQIRKAAARTQEALYAAVANALKTFQPDECANFFAHAGYDLD